MVNCPKEWKTYSFGTYFQLIPNNTLSRENLSNSGVVGNIHYGDVLIKYGDILSDLDDIPRVREDISFVPSNLLQKNDVIIADTAEDDTVGKVTQVGNVSIPLVGGLHTVICRPILETADGFLGYYMNSRYFHDQLLPYITGIKVSSISKKSLNETVLTIPVELGEQRRIVRVLQQIDEHIKNVSKLIEKKKAIREGVLEELMLGKCVLQGFTNSRKSVLLGEVTEVLNGDRGSNYPSDNDILLYGVPFINAGHLRSGQINWDHMEYISPDLYNRLGGVKLKKNDILFCLRGSLGKFAFVNFDDGAPASSLCVLRAKPGINANFLRYLLETSIMKNAIEMANSGSSQPNLSAKEIKSFVFSIPVEHEEQLEIAEILTAMDKEIQELEIERDKLLQIREGAMDDLLTGRIRLTT